MGEGVVSDPQRSVLTWPVQAPERVSAAAQRAARMTLRAQIARLERELGAGTLLAFQRRGVTTASEPSQSAAGPARLLDLGELERVRDELLGRVREAERESERLGERQAAARERLSEMLIEPGRHRFTRISARELGEPGCGVWHVRPRLGLIGMLAGWWHVKLSSGCPLACALAPDGRRAPRSCAAARGSTELSG